MNWQDPAAIAGYIAVGGSGLLALIMKARKVWVRDARDNTYDTEQTKWVEGLQGEIRQLRVEKDALFTQRLEDVRQLAESRAMNEFLTKELERMRKVIDAMEASMTALKAKLAKIDQTISFTESNPLDP